MEETKIAACAWALMSKKNLLLISSCSKDIDKVKGQSLFEYIHPDEVLLAKRDLYKFLNNDLLGGSVTRCRVRDINAIHDIRWIIVDIIMYVATENLVLAFFHQQQQDCCGDNTRSIKNTQLLFHQLSSSLSSAEASEERLSACVSPPNQIFHVLDNSTKSVLLSWPPVRPSISPDHHLYEQQQIMASLLSESRQIQPQQIRKSNGSCFHCVQKPIRFTTSGDKIHCFVIEYGTITFVLFHIEVYNKNQQQLCSDLSSQSDYQSSSTWYNPNSNKSIRRTSAPSSPIRKPFQKSSPSYSATTMNIKHSSIKLESLLLPVTPTPPSPPQQKRNQCQSCGTESSPEWRRGPTGHKTLCNACGLRYSRSVARQGKMAAKQQQQHMMSHQSQNIRMSSPQSPTLSNGSSSGSSPPSSMNFYNKTHSYYYHQSDDKMSLQSKKAFYSNYYHISNSTIMKNANDTTTTNYRGNSNNSRHHKHDISFAVL